jgi:hypothetical protein
MLRSTSVHLLLEHGSQSPHDGIVGEGGAGERVRWPDIHWAVDVILASSLLRSTRLNATPMINLSLTLDDGRVLSYRLTQEELHQWRYTLARGLKDLDYLERKCRAAPTTKGQKPQA